MLVNKVVLFYKRLLGPGGAERQFLEDYRYLRDEGVAVQVLTFEARLDALFGMRIPELEIIPTQNPISALWCLRQRLKKFKPDLISVHSGHIDIYLATRGLGIPYIYYHNSPVCLHSGEEPRALYSFFHRRAFQAIRKSVSTHREYVRPKRSFGFVSRLKLEARALLDTLAIRGANQILVLSNRTVWEIEQMYSRSAFNIRGCLDPRIFSYVPYRSIKLQLGIADKRMILSVSRLSFEKRLGLLLEAFAALISRGDNDCVLVIGGRGPEEAKLRHLATQLHISNRVRFVGFIPDKELWDYFASCDVFATPAYADFDIAPYEALALGRKVVWSIEMETEKSVLESGLVFEAHPTVEDLSWALKKALVSVTNGRPDLTEYTWPLKFERVYRLVAW